jgi:hypothetical protein
VAGRQLRRPARPRQAGDGRGAAERHRCMGVSPRSPRAFTFRGRAGTAAARAPAQRAPVAEYKSGGVSARRRRHGPTLKRDIMPHSMAPDSGLSGARVDHGSGLRSLSGAIPKRVRSPEPESAEQTTILNGCRWFEEESLGRDRARTSPEPSTILAPDSAKPIRRQRPADVRLDLEPFDALDARSLDHTASMVELAELDTALRNVADLSREKIEWLEGSPPTAPGRSPLPRPLPPLPLARSDVAGPCGGAHRAAKPPPHKKCDCELPRGVN